MALSRRALRDASIILAAVIRADSNGNGFTEDAGETATFARALEYVRAKTYDVRYPNLKARTFLPLATDIPAGAESWTYRSWDWVGMAAIIESFADDLPTVELLGREVPHPIRSLGAAYYYDVQEIRAAAFAGVPLDAKKAAAAKRSIENRIDKIAAVGDAPSGLPGFINNPNVPLITTLDTNFNGDWSNPATTAAQILSDLHYIANSIFLASKGAHTPDTMIIPATDYAVISTRPVSDLDPTTTILAAFLAASPYIRNVDQWIYLDTADEAGTGGRVIAYERSADVVELVLPLEFEQLPPQPRNLSFSVPCHARIGGVDIRFPLAVVYADLAP
jgi:hypothetical protein